MIASHQMPQRTQWPIDGNPVRRRVGVAVACGDPDAERKVLDGIGTAQTSPGDFHVVRRCLSAAELLECIASEIADVVVLTTDLHGLSNDALSAVIRAHIP